MEYMLFICSDSAAPEYVTVEDNIVEWETEMEARGVPRHGDRLRPVQDATTVTVRAGEVVVSDGPFAETKEWIAGYDIIACTDLDEAIEVASTRPHGAVREDRDQARVAARDLTMRPPDVRFRVWAKRPGMPIQEHPQTTLTEFDMVNACIPSDGSAIVRNALARLPRQQPEGMSGLAMWIGAGLLRWGRAHASRRDLALREFPLRRQNAQQLEKREEEFLRLWLSKG